MEDIHKWIEVLSQLVNDVRILDLDLLSKESESAWNTAGMELGGEWMRKEIRLCSFFVCLQRIIDRLEVGGRGGDVGHGGWALRDDGGCQRLPGSTPLQAGTNKVTVQIYSGGFRM